MERVNLKAGMRGVAYLIEVSQGDPCLHGLSVAIVVGV